MRLLTHLVLVAPVAFLAAPVAADDGDALGVGQAAWYEHCTVCHGADGRGGGPFVPLLREPPPDLTVLARANGGEFPTAAVRAAVDGRDMPLAHGTSDMPLWGQVLREAGECEERTRSRVADVVAWLRTLQR